MAPTRNYYSVCCINCLPCSHYRKRDSCRVPHALPCGVYRAHDKATICRVLKKQHTANIGHIGHTAKTIFAVCLTLGTRQSCGNGLVARFVCRVPPVWHTANMSPVSIGRVPLRGTRQSLQIFFDFAIPTFSILCIQYMLLRTKLWYFSL